LAIVTDELGQAPQGKAKEGEGDGGYEHRHFLPFGAEQFRNGFVPKRSAIASC
jgi:hypothetical protein